MNLWKVGLSAMIAMLLISFSLALISTYHTIEFINKSGLRRFLLAVLSSYTRDIGLTFDTHETMAKAQAARHSLWELESELDDTFSWFTKPGTEDSVSNAVGISIEHERHIRAFYQYLGVNMTSAGIGDDIVIGITAMHKLASLEYDGNSTGGPGGNLTGSCVEIARSLLRHVTVDRDTAIAEWRANDLLNPGLMPICAQRAMVGLRTAAPDVYISLVLTNVNGGASDLSTFDAYEHIYHELNGATETYVDIAQTICITTGVATLAAMVGTFILLYKFSDSIKKETERNLNLKQAEDRVAQSRKAVAALNHDMKGMIQNIREAMDAKDHVYVDNILQHFIHVLSSLAIKTMDPDKRLEAQGGLRQGTCDTSRISELISSVIPEGKFRIAYVDDDGGPLMVNTDESVLYIILYQLCRNAHTHGCAPRCISIDRPRGSIEICNGPGMNHSRLVDLSVMDAITLCKSGEIGTNVSSGQGITEIEDMCQLLGIEFGIEFLSWPINMVRATITFDSSAFVDETTINDHAGLDICNSTSNACQEPLAQPSEYALLAIDDSKSIRKQSMKILQHLIVHTQGIDKGDLEMGVIRSEHWYTELNECACNRLFVTGHSSPIRIEPICEWIIDAIVAGFKVVTLIDMNLAYDSGICVLGTDVIKSIILQLDKNEKANLIRYGNTSSDNFTFFIRSGNDTREDYDLYITSGAHGMISKGKKIDDVVKSIIDGCNVNPQ